MRYFDCHADTLTMMRDDETLVSNRCDVDLSRVEEFAGRYAQVFAIFDNVALTPPGERDARFELLYSKAIDRLGTASGHVALVRSAGEVHAAHEAGKAAAFLSIEDASFMGSHAPRAFELGFRFAMLTWNHDNKYACGSVADQRRGLTQAGRELVRTYLEQGIVMDVSHLSDAGAEDLFEMCDAPVIASHSNAREVCDVPRNLAHWQIEEIVRRRGLIGLNLFGPFVAHDSPTIDDLLRHADHILGLGGEDVLAMGCDFDGCSGIFPEGVAGVQSMPLIREAFVASLGKDIAEKVFFSNAESFVDRVL